MLQMVKMETIQVQNNRDTMKKKNIFTWLMIACSGLMGLVSVSCSDDMPAESYYTFTGEMMSDYLKNHGEFSSFAEIVSRSRYSQRGVNIMDLLGTYGRYTCFAPTNDAVSAYMKANGYTSLAEIPNDVCDTIARTHLINNAIFYTADFKDRNDVEKVNMNDRYLSLAQVPGANDDITYQLNRSGRIIMAAANDSVENGVVHAVDQVLVSSNQTLTDLMLENPEVARMSEALDKTGMADYISQRIKDTNWDPDAPEYEKYNGKVIYSGAQDNYCRVPETRNFKFTVFACTDKVLKDKYGIETLEQFYNYARDIYGGEAYDPSNPEQLKDVNNPLHRLIAYQCLPFATSYDKYTSICTLLTNTRKAFVNPTEWYSTMDPLTTMKIEHLYSATEIQQYGGVQKDMYLNRGDMIRSFSKGVHVERKLSDPEMIQDALNGTYFLTDGLIDFGEETQSEIFNTRIRFDMMSCFPEMISNNLRNSETHTPTDPKDPESPARNYILPQGYLDDVTINEQGTLLYQGARNSYWSYLGDEFNVCSDQNSYDIEFYLPSVPDGQYQIRLGLADMPTRGICQFYLDGVPQGSPFDERSDNFEQRIGYVPMNTLDGSGYTSEEKEAVKKNMHNLGWYHGPKSVFSVSGTNHPDGQNALGQGGTVFADNARTMRYVLATVNLDRKTRHKIRIKSIWAVGNALVMMDYFELVPKSVYGVEGSGKAEDDY